MTLMISIPTHWLSHSCSLPISPFNPYSVKLLSCLVNSILFRHSVIPPVVLSHYSSSSIKSKVSAKHGPLIMIPSSPLFSPVHSLRVHLNPAFPLISSLSFKIHSHTLYRHIKSFSGSSPYEINCSRSISHSDIYDSQPYSNKIHKKQPALPVFYGFLSSYPLSLTISLFSLLFHPLP